MNEARRILRPRRVWSVALFWGWSVCAHAAPALPGDMVRDLEALQQRLTAGETSAVVEAALAQARRLQGGNAADRWAQALYLQLAATAASRQGRDVQSADLLQQARDIADIDAEHRARWLRQEAHLRLHTGQTEHGSELLGRWLAEHDAGTADLWLMAQAQASLSHWEQAATWVERAMQHDADPDEVHLSLAASVYQHAGREEQALSILDRLLAQAPDDAEQWRRAAGLAQRLGDHGRAAALWEAGWRRGVLQGDRDLLTRVRLHVAGGTPARAAEILQAALDNGELEDSLEYRRLLADAWTAARDRQRALTAWRTLAERSGKGDDWLRLGQLAHAWGEEAIASTAFQRADRLGVKEAEAWQAYLKNDQEVQVKKTPDRSGQASPRGDSDQNDSSVHTGA
ncbi:tetratricopeptide repeat protein [Litchfieldella anticariensis]|uniref:tetratricopeptide repeat protein n=1 Tax=Litchfieldella anticariensis TaxID=258591 RepID=UPI000398F8C5|nr:tetratricopeptide repeat protein [Halomonas anticariensis]